MASYDGVTLKVFSEGPSTDNVCLRRLYSCVLDCIHLSATGVAEIAKSTHLKGCPHTAVYIVCVYSVYTVCVYIVYVLSSFPYLFFLCLPVDLFHAVGQAFIINEILTLATQLAPTTPTGPVWYN